MSKVTNIPSRAIPTCNCCPMVKSPMSDTDKHAGRSLKKNTISVIRNGNVTSKSGRQQQVTLHQITAYYLFTFSS